MTKAEKISNLNFFFKTSKQNILSNSGCVLKLSGIFIHENYLHLQINCLSPETFTGKKLIKLSWKRNDVHLHFGRRISALRFAAPRKQQLNVPFVDSGRFSVILTQFGAKLRRGRKCHRTFSRKNKKFLTKQEKISIATSWIPCVPSNSSLKFPCEFWLRLPGKCWHFVLFRKISPLFQRESPTGNVWIFTKTALYLQSRFQSILRDFKATVANWKKGRLSAQLHNQTEFEHNAAEAKMSGNWKFSWNMNNWRLFFMH